MKEIIELHSRSKYEHHYLKKMAKPDGSESKTYVLKLSDPFLRSGVIKGHKFVDPTGGPMIMEGSKLEEAEAVVKSIDHVMGVGYAITFEVTPEEEQELVDAIVNI